MVPVRFSSNYQRYKDGTRKIVDWLFETVKVCPTYQTFAGYTASTVLVGLYPAIARAIAEPRTEIEVPGKIIRLLGGVIIGRKRSASWYDNAENSPGPVPRDNSQHRHFIAILERILLILEPLKKASQHPYFLPVIHDRQVTDYLGELELEDQESDSDNIPSTPPKNDDDSPKSLAQPASVYDFEREDKDALLAISCFFELFRDVRTYLRTVWSHFRDDKISLINAFIVTKTAFEMARYAEVDLVALFPKLSSYEEMAKYLSMELLELKSLYEDQSSGSQGLPCVDTFQALHMFTSTNGVHDFITPEFTVDNAAPSTSVRSYVKLLHSDDPRRLDRYHLAALVFELRLYFMSSRDESSEVAYHDLLSTGIFKIFEGQAIPVLDKSRCWDQLSCIGGSIYSSIDKYFKVWNDSRIPYPKHRLPLMSENEYENFTRKLRILGQNAWNMLEKEPYSTRSIRERLGFENCSKWHIYHINPFLCGHLALLYSSQLHMSGIELVNGSWDLFPLAHLYNAGRLNNHLEHRWVETETLLSIHDHQYLLLPESNDAATLYRRLRIAQGESILNYARNPRHDGRTRRQNPVKKIKPAALIETFSLLSFDREESIEDDYFEIKSVDRILWKVAELSHRCRAATKKSTQDP
ncbi:hypothetical protein AOQ84DRAFT_359795 [Glonium stellatum]|uniref:DUF6604 domain-containing protein n=1 Tax=Glonium stellatum TaxID=574774 RepID=A0A8E2JXR5_9PEZI|nr:hypothetical protein AOQ84DRAFT_359795 [Glonium stellatum]